MTGTDRPWLSVVIPAFDEAQRIGESLQRLAGFLTVQTYASEVVVVDDGSRDATALIVEAFAAERNDVRCLRLAHAGKGSAVRAGMLAARGQWRYLCDADLSTPPEEIPRFLPPATSGIDIAVGSREAPGAQRIDEPWRRHFIGRVFNGLVRRLAVRGIADTQCGFKAFRGGVAEALFSRQRLDGFGFDVEVLALAQRMGYSIREIPVPWQWKAGSKVRAFRDARRMFFDVLAVRRDLRRGAYGELEGFAERERDVVLSPQPPRAPEHVERRAPKGERAPRP